jgi:serine/threonine-protein kinase
VTRLSFWKSDWFVGLAVVVLFLVLNQATTVVASLERWAYDWGVRATTRVPSDRVAVIAIDDVSIANIGRWPWSRDVHARMLDLLGKAKVKVVGNTVFFFEPQLDPGLAYVNRLIDLYRRGAASVPTDAALPPAWEQFGGVLAEAEQALNTDRQLAASLGGTGNVLLPMEFAIFEPLGKPDQPLPEYVARNALTAIEQGTGDWPLATGGVQYPVAEIGEKAAGIGHLSYLVDVDGSVRAEPLVLRHYDQVFPSLSLLIAARSLNLGIEDVRVVLGEAVRLGNLRIGGDPYLRMYTYYYGDRDGRPAFPVDSFYDVLSGKIPAEKYRDKIVLIGATAVGVGTQQVTPIGLMTPVHALAHSVSSILKEDFFVVPPWAPWAELAAFLLVAVFLVGILPRLKAGLGFAVTMLLLAAFLGTHFALMTTKATWIQLMLPATLLLLGYGLMTTKRFLVTEKGKIRSEAESAESNRMLGLAFQGQGQLDMAFDKFRKVPLDAGMMDILYNLGLDFERKRQFNKAEAVYQYMATFDPKYKDLPQKLTRAKAMSETVILGGGGGARTAGGTLIMDAGGAVEKPMLGRYQVEKELGKGAMGVVYQGRDPKIGRVVAIKTMALSQEFEAEELEEARSRFFREAETAGRLNHPNIVTIYDAGEEHDLCYIAMEFLKGKDLVPYVKADALLPLPRVLSIVARVAEALHYAHAQGVIHRDIKPANIMYEPVSDTVKVTDFGIARVTDSSKTKTGMVLGTPSFMSPEQLAGRKIDGRSDLFSLGVMLFQLACGKLPFQGDSMAQLMFRIANERHPDILTIAPGLPPCMREIIEVALAKLPEERFQNGEEMALAIRACASQAGLAP